MVPVSRNSANLRLTYVGAKISEGRPPISVSHLEPMQRFEPILRRELDNAAREPETLPA